MHLQHLRHFLTAVSKFREKCTVNSKVQVRNIVLNARFCFRSALKFGNVFNEKRIYLIILSFIRVNSQILYNCNYVLTEIKAAISMRAMKCSHL